MSGVGGAPSPAPCLNCGKPVDPTGRFAPFCCQRCQMVDLGRWLRGDYRVPGEPIEGPTLPGDDPDDDR